MKRDNNIIRLALMSLVLTAGLSGCNKGSKLKEEGALKEVGAETITVFMYDFEDWSNDYFINAIDKYNDNLNDGVEVLYELLDEEAYTYRVDSSREAGSAPDIYLVAHTNLWQEVVNESITPLEGIFDEEFFEDYTDTAKEAATLYGSTYAVPYCFEPSMLLYYSKSLFAQAGITKEPETYEEMLAVCEKLKGVIDSKQQTVLGTPIGLPMGWANVGQFYNAADGKFPISDDWSQSIVATENMEGYKEFLEYYTKLYNDGYASRSDTAGGYNEIINELCEGRVAMTFAGSYAVGQIYQDYIEEGYLDNADDIGCCLAPRKNKDLGATANGGWAFVLDKSTVSKNATANEKVQGKTHADLAADFLNWYTRDSQVAAGFFELGHCSKQTGFKSVQTVLDSSQVNNPFYEVIKEAANTATPLYRYPYSITQACSDMISTLISKTNKNSVEQVIGVCHAEIQKQIEINQLAGKNPSNAK